tara:strand:- start:98 stop:934 length:837 start_codon:yes stop_codon:yes gene_type:complete
MKIILSLFLFVGLINIFIIVSEGFKSRFSKIKTIFPYYQIDGNILDFERKNFNRKNNKNIFIEKNKLKILIIGDSYAQDLYNLFNTNSNLKKKYEFVLFDNHDLNFKKLINNENYKKSNIIILSYRWKDKKKNNDRILLKLDQHIKNLKNKNIIIASNKTEFRTYGYLTKTIIDDKVLKNINNLENFNINKYKKNYFEKRLIGKNSQINKTLENISKKNEVKFFNFEDLQCNYTNYECEYLTNNGSKIYYDYGHFTVEGSGYISKKFENLLEAIILYK